MKYRSCVPLVIILAVAAFGCTDDAPRVRQEQHEPSPYAGQEMRPVKSLSEDRVAGLLAGEGLGYAKVAELNGYPGPKHVLELATELELSEDQANQTQVVFEIMNAAARRLGAELVEVEEELDSLFAAGETVDSSAVVSAMQRAGELEARLRWTHVEAHLRQTEILSRHQRMLYSELRGYGSNGDHQHDPSHNHSQGT